MTPNRELNILVVTPSLPYPPIWGFGMRVFQIVKHLAQNHNVTLLTYAGPADSENLVVLRGICQRVHVVNPREFSGAGKRIRQWASIFSRRSFQRSSLYSRAMQKAINDLLAAERFDIVQIESSQMAVFEFKTSACLLVDEHNIEYELLHRMYQTEKSPVRRLFNWVEYLKFRREEHRCWNRTDGCIMTSDREQLILQRYQPDRLSFVAPNGVDIEYFHPSGNAPAPANIVFTGLMRYRPNIDAVVYFVQEILPLIRRQRPDATFTIVGAGPPEEVTRLAGSHVTVTDTVPDVRPYVENAALVVVPLRMGSGTRLKVLEGLAMGKPMVSTSLGCEGIYVQDELQLLVAEKPQPFADAVLRVFNNPSLGQRLGEQGRCLVEEHYSWPSIVHNLEGFYLKALDVQQQTSSNGKRLTQLPHAATALICTSDRGDSIVPTIQSILYPESVCTELIIIDQSTDSRTEEAIAPFKADPRLRYVRMSTKGKGLALNYGLSIAQNDIVAITDDDCEVDHGWPSFHVDALRRCGRVAVSYGNVEAAEHDPRRGFIPDYTVKRDKLYRHIFHKLRARGIGANTAVRRDLVLRMGGFDPTLGPGGKFTSSVDMDITVRALLAGYHVADVKTSRVRHFGFRNWEQGRDLTQNAWLGIGAVCAKPLKCGRWDTFPITLYEFLYHALLPAIWNTLTLRSKKGWLRVIFFLKGFSEGLRTPVDREKILYTPD